jgi:hypothetical protein
MLFDKIISLYPSLTDSDFVGLNATIQLQNDSDGKGDYIALWRHPTYPKPTDAQLAEIN